MNYRAVFTTDRGEWHQETALAGAPDFLEVQFLRSPSRSALKRALHQADFLISERAGIIDAPLLAAAPHLKLIQRLGSQIHDIDLEAARAAGIAVCCLPIEGVILVAEHVMMQLLAVAKRLGRVEGAALNPDPAWGKSRPTDEDTFAYNWSGQKDLSQLWMKTVGVIGFGEIGFELCRRLAGWGTRILYYKRSRLPTEVEQKLDIEYQDPKQIMATADYLVNLLPFVPGTKIFFNKQAFQHMKPGAYLVSCGSGGTIDEGALVDALTSGRLAGAALDTFAYEPLPADSRLIAAARAGENLLLTPHTAAGSPDGELPDRSDDYQNIRRYVVGEELVHRLV